jgi:ParB family chromosome partitioning protein
MAPKLRAKRATRNQGTTAIPIEDIVADPSQPRKTFAPEGLANLADSLLRAGQISPIVVRPVSEGKYMIVVGERRWRAAREAGLSQIECIIRHDLDEQKARELQFAENYQHDDVPPLEQARSFKHYLDTYKVSQSELSRRTGIPQRSISDRLALLKLPASVHARMAVGDIGPYEATKIAALPPDRQEAVAEAVASGRIGGRALERLAHAEESFLASNGIREEALQPTKVTEMIIGLSQRLQNLEKAVYGLLETYTFNEASNEMGVGARSAPPCPECAKQGNKAPISIIKRRSTPEDHQESIDAIESIEDLSEEEKEEILEREPAYVIEVKCRECGYTYFIGYAEE